MKLLLMWCKEGKLTITLPLSTRVWQHMEIQKLVLNLWIFLKAEGMLVKLANTQWVETTEWCILGKKKDHRICSQVPTVVRVFKKMDFSKNTSSNGGLMRSKLTCISSKYHFRGSDEWQRQPEKIKPIPRPFSHWYGLVFQKTFVMPFSPCQLTTEEVDPEEGERRTETPQKT